MRVALGFKAHSGWAALVALGRAAGDLVVVDRRRIELADPADGEWARQPYHAAEGLPSARAKAVVERGVATARRMAAAELRSAVSRAKEAGHRVIGCAVLVGHADACLDRRRDPGRSLPHAPGRGRAVPRRGDRCRPRLQATDRRAPRKAGLPLRPRGGSRDRRHN